MDPCTADASFWNNLVAANAKDGNFRNAYRAFKRMPQLTAEACVAMSIACIVAGRLESARRIFEKCHHKDVLAWNAVLAAFARNGHLLEAKTMFRRLPRRSLGSFKGMIAAYAKKGKSQKARMVFRQIPEDCRKLDYEIAEMLIRGYGSQGLALEAKNIFESMHQGTSSSSCSSAMIESYLWNKQHLQAALLLNISPALDARALGRLINAFDEAGDFDTAKKLFDHSRPGSGSTVELWNSMLSLCCKGEKLDLPKAVFDAMPARNFSSWSTIFASYLRRRTLQETRALFDDMPERSHSSWTTMIAAYTRRGHPAEALQLFKLMDLDGFFPDHATYTNALFVSSTMPENEEIRKAVRLSRQPRTVETDRNSFQETIFRADRVESILEPCYELDLSPPLPPKKEKPFTPPGTISKKELRDQEAWQPERNTYITRLLAKKYVQ